VETLVSHLAHTEKTADGVRLEIEPLFPNSSSLKLTIQGTGESRHIREFTAKVAFLTLPQHYEEENCSVIVIPNGSRLMKAEVEFDYEDPDVPDPHNMWLVANLEFWCNSYDPLLCIRIMCVKVENQQVIETTLTPPEGVTFH